MESETREITKCKSCVFLFEMPEMLARNCKEQKNLRFPFKMTLPPDYKHPDCEIISITINRKKDGHDQE